MGMRQIGALWLAAFAACWFVSGEPAKQAAWPAGCLIQPGQRILLLGDSIIGPGMYGHAANSLLDKLYPDSGVTFHCFGMAGTTTESIQPHLEGTLKGKSYDWILLNFGHNDAGKFTPEAFKESGKRLLAAMRALSPARFGWMGVLGAEPSPYADDAQQARQREKHVALARATKELCEAEKVAYIPLHEAFTEMLRERQAQGLKLAFTMDTSHPNVLGNWLVGAALLHGLGFKPEPMTLDLLQGEATSDQGRLPVEPLEKPLDVRFESLFLRVRLIPPPVSRVACEMARPAIVLDGKLTEWKDVPECRISAPLHVTWELVPRCASAYAASARTCRDAETLYFAFQVKAPDVKEGTVFPEIVELFIDARKDTSSTGVVWHRTKGLTQFAFHRDFRDPEKPAVVVGANGDASQGEGVRAAVARAADGYTLEVAIPAANFRQIEVKPGAAIPWDWAVSFTDQAVNLDWLGLMSRMQSTRGYGWLVLK
jgi:hypothetical protein